jgi:hypothetical protein
MRSPARAAPASMAALARVPADQLVMRGRP